MPAPRVTVDILKPFGSPQAKAVSIPILAKDELATADEIENFIQLDIGSGSGTGKTNALLPSFSFGYDDTTLSNWSPIITDSEAVEMALMVDAYVDELEGIYGGTATATSPFVAITAIESENKSSLWSPVATALGITAPMTLAAEKIDRVWDIWTILKTVSLRGYWTEKQNLFGDGQRGLYRGCSAPNVSWEIVSNFKLDADRPFTLFLHHAMPDQSQTDGVLRIEWGLWAFEIHQTSSMQFYKFNPDLTPAERADLRAQVDALKDGGALVAASQAEIITSQDAIGTIKTDAQQEGRKPSASENTQIATLNARIQELKDEARGLEKTAEQSRQVLLKELYEDIQTVQFAESLQTYYGIDLPITFVPQRRGFISIHIGRPGSKNYWVYSDKDTLEKKTWVSMWKGSDGSRSFDTPLRLTSNGGAFWFRFSYPIVSKYCRILSGLRRVDRDVRNLSGDDLVLSPNWDPIPATWDNSSRTWAGATCTLTGQIIALSADMDYGKFRWQLEVETDSKHMPAVYALQLTVLATPRDRSEETLVWSSVSNPAAVISATPRMAELGDAAGYDVVLMNLNGELSGELGWLHNHQLVIRNMHTGRVLFTGIITDDAAEAVGKYTTRIALGALDRTAVLSSDMIEAETPADGTGFGTYLGMQLREAGFWPDEIEIQDCTETARVLPYADPGEDVAIKPEVGAYRQEFLTSLFESHTYGMVRYFDEDGRWHWEQKSYSVVPGLVFRHAHQAVGDRRVMWNVREWLDFADFRNDFTVVGREWPPDSGKQPVTRYQHYPSVNDQSDVSWIKRWRPEPPVQDDSLRSQAETDFACRRRFELVGQPKWLIECETYYHDDITQQTRFQAILNRPEGSIQVAVQVHDIQGLNQVEDRMTLVIEVIDTAGLREGAGRP